MKPATSEPDVLHANVKAFRVQTVLLEIYSICSSNDPSEWKIQYTLHI